VLLEDQVIAVTGAGHGMGRAYAAAIVDHGGRVGAIDIDTGRLDSLARELGDRCIPIARDLAIEGDAAIRELIDRAGKIDGLINNAAAFRVESFTEHSMDSFDLIVGVNLRERMQASGVIGAPEITYMTPVREAIVWDRELPAFMLSHSVADFDRWLVGYDGAADLQAAKGIVGHAANRSIDDPNLAIIYHQAESFDTLRAFLADDDLKAKMQEAGVTSAPEVQFVTGGWAKLYG